MVYLFIYCYDCFLFCCIEPELITIQNRPIKVKRSRRRLPVLMWIFLYGCMHELIFNIAEFLFRVCPNTHAFRNKYSRLYNKSNTPRHNTHQLIYPSVSILKML